MTIEELKSAYEKAKHDADAAFDADNAARAAFQLAYARELRTKAEYESAKALADLAGHRGLTDRDISRIRALGYTVKG